MSEVTSNPGNVAQLSGPPGVRPRVWPAVLILGVLWAAKLLTERFWQGEPAFMYAVFYGPMVAAVLVLLCWLFVSRVPWRDRLLILLMVVAGGAMTVLTDVDV